MHKLSFLLIAAVCLFAAPIKSEAQCPTLESYSQGNGGPTSCPNVSGTAYDTADFAGTKYATIPTSQKTGNFTASWASASPSVVPAIGGFYQGTTKLADTAGPASTVTVQSNTYKYKYCFYGPTNLPNSGNYTVLFVNPVNDTLIYSCTYTGSNNSVTSVAGVSITSQPSNQVGCIGYKTTFSLTATPGTVNDPLTYQWKKNGNDISGATSSSYTINAVSASDTGTSIYSCVVTESANTTVAVSRSVSLTLNKQASFNGSSTSWSTASNWSTGTTPDSTVHAYIPAGLSNYPNVTTGTVKCKCLTLESGASLTVNGGTIEIAGRINNSGTITATNGSITLNGTSVAQNIPASTFASNTIKDLTINNSTGVSLSGTLNITGTYTPTSGTFTTGGFLTLMSSSSGTANVAQGSSSGGYVSGNVTVERYIPNHTNRAWRLLAPNTNSTQTIKAAWQEGATSLSNNPNPGYGTLITCNSNYSTAAGFDSVMPSMSILAYDVTNQNWTSNPVTNTNSKLISSERGYFLYMRGDRTVTPSSSILSPTNTTLRTTGSLYMGDQSAITIPAGKYVLVGNPFASPIDFSTISASDRSNVSNMFWLWDPMVTGSNGLGSYVLFSAATVTPWLPSILTGSFSLATSTIPSGMAFFVKSSGSAGTLTLRESIKTSGSLNTGFKSTANTSTEQLQVNLSVVKTDGSVVGADGLFVLFNDAYADTVDGDDAVKPTNFSENFGTITSGKTLALDARNPVTNTDTVFFKMWKMQQLDYRLTVNATNFHTPGLNASLIDRYLNNATPLDLNGLTDYNFTVNSDTASYSQNRFYIAMEIKPLSVKDNKSDDITIYPNPTDNNQININFNNITAGNYNIALYNSIGEKVASEDYHHNGNASVKRMQTAVLPRGNYNLVITNNGTFKKSIKVIFK